MDASRRDYRDDVIVELADSECLLSERVAVLQAERDAFRTFAALVTYYNIELWRELQMTRRGSHVYRRHVQFVREAVERMGEEDEWRTTASVA